MLPPVQGLSEAVGGAVGVALQRVVTTRYDEVFKNVVLPGFEKACQEMFRQMDDAFRRGTTECKCALNYWTIEPYPDYLSCCWKLGFWICFRYLAIAVSLFNVSGDVKAKSPFKAGL